MTPSRSRDENNPIISNVSMSPPVLRTFLLTVGLGPTEASTDPENDTVCFLVFPVVAFRSFTADNGLVTEAVIIDPDDKSSLVGSEWWKNKLGEGYSHRIVGCMWPEHEDGATLKQAIDEMSKSARFMARRELDMMNAMAEKMKSAREPKPTGNDLREALKDSFERSEAAYRSLD